MAVSLGLGGVGASASRFCWLYGWGSWQLGLWWGRVAVGVCVLGCGVRLVLRGRMWLAWIGEVDTIWLRFWSISAMFVVGLGIGSMSSAASAAIVVPVVRNAWGQASLQSASSPTHVIEGAA